MMDGISLVVGISVRFRVILIRPYLGISQIIRVWQGIL